MFEHWNLLITWGGTFLAGAFGVGVGYATLREQLVSFKREFTIYRETAAAASAAAAIVASEQLTSIKERISKVEGKTEYQVGYDRCRDMRDECSGRLSLQLVDLSKQVSENRTLVTGALKEIERFMGRVETFIEQNGKAR